MNLICLDLEGVLSPELWVAIAEASNLPELKRTTRDEPDYHKLMTWRLGVLRENGLTLPKIQAMLESIAPLPGARDFLDDLRKDHQVIILSDTFVQFAMPMMRQLNYPTLFCNELIVDEEGVITDFHMRCDHTKLTTVRALQSCGFETVVAGDSHNDLEMIAASKAGFLFRSTDSIKAAHPDVEAFEDYGHLSIALKEACIQ